MDIINFIIFLALAGSIILSSLAVIFSPKIMYSILGAVVCFLSVGGLFFQLNADFIGVSQIVIYGVGIAIVFVFALMLTCQKEEKNLWIAFKPRTLVALICCGLLFLIIMFCINGGIKSPTNKGVFSPQQYSEAQIKILKGEGTTGLIGEKLFSDYVLPFELLSLLLLAGIIGTGSLATTTKEEREES